MFCFHCSGIILSERVCGWVAFWVLALSSHLNANLGGCKILGSIPLFWLPTLVCLPILSDQNSLGVAGVTSPHRALTGSLCLGPFVLERSFHVSPSGSFHLSSGSLENIDTLVSLWHWTFYSLCSRISFPPAFVFPFPGIRMMQMQELLDPDSKTLHFLL